MEHRQWAGNMQNQLKFMLKEDHSHLLPQLLEYKNSLDKLHNTKYGDYFPEFERLLNEQ
jgi:hypothetical protein